MKSVADFNYKVALASGLRHLQRGKLRQAEEQFRYLVAKFPAADGGYRGLARVQVELGDRPAALGVLRDGASALARAGQRPAAIELLREAVALDPLDLSAHRRLAAAFALSGDVAAAAAEYERFAGAEMAAGDPERAKLETSYALDTLGEIPALHALASSLGIALRTAPWHAPAGPTAEPPAAPVVPAPVAAEPPVAPGGSVADRLPAARRPAGPPRAAVPSPADRSEVGAPAHAAPPAPAVDPFALEAEAMALIAARDPAAATVGVRTARALLARGKMYAASDLLLDMIACGIGVHEAERELVAVSRALGRDDIADERERLLVEAAGGG